MTIWRRIVQVSAILLLLALPMLSRGSALLEAYGKGATHVGSLAGPWEHFLFASFSFLFGWLDDPVAAAALFQGSFWSITLFGVTFSDPLALVGHLVASGAVYWPLVIGAGLSVALAVVAGRFFCGWICPVNTLLELNAKLRAWIERRLILQRLPEIEAPGWARWAVLGGALIISAVAGFNLFAFILPYVGIGRDWYLFVFGSGVGFGVLFMVVIAAVELLFAPRIWCKGLCPTGLVLELFGRRRLVGIRRRAEASCLAGCRACVSACPVGVDPGTEAATEQCLLCNVCVERCPADILKLGRTSARRRRPLPVTAMMVLAALSLVLPGAAQARHIKGLPHYGYLENYPQTPTRELRFNGGPFEVTLVTYVMEGLQRDTSDTPDDAMVYVSVIDTRSGKSHTGPLTVTFRPLGGGAAIVRKFSTPLEETVYRARMSLPGPAYDVVIGIGGAGGAVATARLQLAEGGLGPWAWSIILVIALAAGTIGVAMLRRQARRRQRQEMAKTLARKLTAAGGEV